MVDSIIESVRKSKKSKKSKKRTSKKRTSKKPCGRCTKCTQKTGNPSSCKRTSEVFQGCPCPAASLDELATLQHLLRIKLEAIRNAA